jgi:hypothetical protein
VGEVAAAVRGEAMNRAVKKWGPIAVGCLGISSGFFTMIQLDRDETSSILGLIVALSFMACLSG